MIRAHREPLEPLRPELCGRRVCAWCVPPRDLGPAPGVPAGSETTGICPECYARERAAMAAPADSGAAPLSQP